MLDTGAFLEVVFDKEGVKVTDAPETVLQLRGKPMQACPAPPVSAPRGSPLPESPSAWGGEADRWQVRSLASVCIVHRKRLGCPQALSSGCAFPALII